MLLGRTSHHDNDSFVYGTHTPYGLALTTSSTTTTPQRPGWRPQEQRIPQPRSCNPRQVSHTTGLATIRFRSPLLTESLLFSLPMGTEMFHFPTFPPHPLYIQLVVTRHHSCWVSPFGHPRISARLTAPRGLSQPPTSFIGSWCQGIHRVLLHTYIHKQLKMLASTVQFSNNTHQPHPHPTTHSGPTRRIGNQCHQKQPNPSSRFDGVVSDTQQCVSSRTLTPPPEAGPEPAPVRSRRVRRAGRPETTARRPTASTTRHSTRVAR